MNRLVSLFCILSISISIYGQQLEGSYKYQNDSLYFSNNAVKFNLSDFSALSSQIVGEGTYEHYNNFLIINTDEYTGDKSKYSKQAIETKGEPIITVLGTNGYPFQGVLIEFLSNSNKVISQAISNDDGKVANPINEKIKKIKATSMGHNEIEFDIESDVDYSIVLAKNIVIQDQTVVLEFIEGENDSFSVRLLSDNFESGKNRDKDLDKISKKADKLNILSKKLTKEYISTFYNK